MAQVIDRDLGWQKLKRDIAALAGRSVKVGILGDGAGAGDTSLVDIAFFQEFGTSRIPARPFMATTADRYGDRILDLAEKLAGDILDGKSDPDRVLNVLGMEYQKLIQQTIRQAGTWAAPNAPATVARKGSSSPLIDTERLIQSISYEVD